MALVRSIIQAYRVMYINVFWTRVDKKSAFSRCLNILLHYHLKNTFNGLRLAPTQTDAISTRLIRFLGKKLQARNLLGVYISSIC